METSTVPQAALVFEDGYQRLAFSTWQPYPSPLSGHISDMVGKYEFNHNLEE
jgi:hypothetical protein